MKTSQFDFTNQEKIGKKLVKNEPTFLNAWNFLNSDFLLSFVWMIISGVLKPVDVPTAFGI